MFWFVFRAGTDSWQLTAILFALYVNIKQRFVKMLLENSMKDGNLQKAYLRGEYEMP